MDTRPGTSHVDHACQGSDDSTGVEDQLLAGRYPSVVQGVKSSPSHPGDAAALVSSVKAGGCPKDSHVHSDTDVVV
ncbi:hypothetical protein Pcinc_019178 [Petrolisthes cinctipes]|uniref:Uncharacterized protein n=1 Tax=Petrolisthes cinctipes TaxID=88211 RepID=A0AAE1FMR7_PETCI|nr:hypothetical protein Pcinc_019178 [Petrolisthes cinctipes]